MLLDIWQGLVGGVILNSDRYIAWTEDRATSDTAERIFCCLGTATGHVTIF